MAPPTKRQRQLRRILDAKKQATEIRRIELQLLDDVEKEGDEFNLDGMALNQELVRMRWEDLIKRNPSAYHTMKSAYTGDSRATKYRTLKDKKHCHRSVADCPKVNSFFTQIRSSKVRKIT